MEKTSQSQQADTLGKLSAKSASGKWLILIVVVLVCILLSGIGGYFLGTQITHSQTTLATPTSSNLSGKFIPPPSPPTTSFSVTNMFSASLEKYCKDGLIDINNLPLEIDRSIIHISGRGAPGKIGCQNGEISTSFQQNTKGSPSILRIMSVPSDDNPAAVNDGSISDNGIKLWFQLGGGQPPADWLTPTGQARVAEQVSIYAQKPLKLRDGSTLSIKITDGITAISFDDPRWDNDPAVAAYHNTPVETNPTATSPRTIAYLKLYQDIKNRFFDLSRLQPQEQATLTRISNLMGAITAK